MVIIRRTMILKMMTRTVWTMKRIILMIQLYGEHRIARMTTMTSVIMTKIAIKDNDKKA